MNDQDNVPDATQASVTDELRRSMNYLMVHEGLPVVHVLAVMHAEIIMQMTAVFGGKGAVACMAAAMNRVEFMPSLAEVNALAKASNGRLQ